jgi:ABC-type Fe3+-hydroxamate transport system substrate-binding protein
MKNIIIIMIPFALAACSFTEPSALVVKNSSDYEIEVTISGAGNKELSLEKKHGDIVYLYPGKVDIVVEAKEIFLKREYSFNISYMEKKKFEFSTE